MITYTYRIDLVPGSVPTVIHVSQGDSDLTFVFELYARMGSLFLLSGTSAELRGKTSEGKRISIPGTLVSNKATFPLPDGMTEKPGRTVYEIVLISSGKEIASANFYLQVEQRAGGMA